MIHPHPYPFQNRSYVSVTFFNNFGGEFEKALRECKTEKVVVLISSAKVNEYEGVTIY